MVAEGFAGSGELGGDKIVSPICHVRQCEATRVGVAAVPAVCGPHRGVGGSR
jgi:hypothetical protein